MAGKLPSFLNGTTIMVELGGVQVAELQALSFQENVQNQLTYAMGSFGPVSNEPLLLTGHSGTMRILRYTDAALAVNGQTGLDGRRLTTALEDAANMIQTAVRKKGTDGNSLAYTTSFSPAHLLLESTFDIKIYERTSASKGNTIQNRARLLYTLKDVILTGWSLGFSVGSVVNEDVSFICRMIVNEVVETSKTINNP